jgi:hypothetical protein
MNRNLHQAFAPVLLTLGLFSAAAVAQNSAPASTPAPAPAAGQASASQAAPSQARAASHAKKHQDRVEERITRLHTQLKITSEQAGQWETFAQTMRENAQRIDQAIQDRAKKLPSMNADEAMKSYAALGQVHAEDLQKLSAAFSGLYGVLSDAQKQTADVLFRDEHAGKSAKHHSHHKTHKKPQQEAAPAAAAPAPAAK